MAFQVGFSVVESCLYHATVRTRVQVQSSRRHCQKGPSLDNPSFLSVTMGTRELRYALSRVDNLSEDFWVHVLKLSGRSSKVVLQR